MRQPHSAIQSEPVCDFVLVLQEHGFDVPPYHLPLPLRRLARIAGHHREEAVIAISKHFKSRARIVSAASNCNLRHAAEIVRSSIVLRNDHVRIRCADIVADVMRPIEVIKRRNRNQHIVRNCMQPGEIYEGIGFVFDCWSYDLDTGDLDGVREPYPRLRRFADTLEGFRRPDGRPQVFESFFSVSRVRRSTKSRGLSGFRPGDGAHVRHRSRGARDLLG